jgi:hypothetical protein
MWQDHQTSLYNASTGALITQFYPGPEVCGSQGWVDGNSNIHIYQRANGEYIIMEEDDGYCKVLIYRWNPWMDLDIGATGGSSSYNAATGAFTINGTGTGIGGSANDGFHYVYRGMTGDGTICAYLGSNNCSNSTAQAGVMIRNDLTTSGETAAGMGETVAGNITGLWWRATTGSTGSSSKSTGVPPLWFEVTRSGNNFSAYDATDGVNWTQLSTTKTIAMNTEVYVGLPVTSNKNTTTTATATISNVTTTP